MSFIEKINKYKVVIFILCFIAVGIVGTAVINHQKSKPPIVISEVIAQTTPEPKKVVINIKGAVQNSGVYELEQGARLQEAIDTAGGLQEGAIDRSNMNLATLLVDQDEIIIPFAADVEKDKSLLNIIRKPAGTSGASQITQGAPPIAKININTASIEELNTIPGIGDTFSKRIIDYRDQNGDFRDIESIMNVQGISGGRFENIKEYICVE